MHTFYPLGRITKPISLFSDYLQLGEWFSESCGRSATCLLAEQNSYYQLRNFKLARNRQGLISHGARASIFSLTIEKISWS